ncbi:hypothetical protein P4908_09650 [Pantoea ananatis]|uniref:hypothetical protein n=1 Tax=Pantoea ananas TaxID=553 RepID=UPI0023F97510|nr:hypothetical protein [Pantoea ananatis]MDF7790500.1 hypothetical protein [Pantoea ananatis]
MNNSDYNESMEFYIGSYMNRPFWVGKCFDIYDADQRCVFDGIIPDIAVKTQNEYFKAAICVNGLLLLRIQHLAQAMPDIGNPTHYNNAALWLDKCLDYVNALQICLESESIKCVNSHNVRAITTRTIDICKVGMLRGKALNCSLNTEYGNSQAVVMNELKRWIANDGKWPSPLETDGWRLPHEFISIDAVKRAFDMFSNVVNDEIKIRWLSYLVKAKTAYAENDYRMSFVLSWFVIESNIKSSLYSSGTIKKTHIHEMIKQLYSQGVLSEEIRKRLDHLRKIRNCLMHNPVETFCSSHDCIEAGQVALNLVVSNPNTNIVLSWHSSFQF